MWALSIVVSGPADASTKGKDHDWSSDTTHYDKDDDKDHDDDKDPDKTTTTTTTTTLPAGVGGSDVTTPAERETTAPGIDDPAAGGLPPDEVGGVSITSPTVADEVGAVIVLPFTGSNTGSLVAVATVALALGGVLVVGARRADTE